MLWDRWTYVMDQSSNKDIKWGGRPTRLLLHVSVRRALSRSFDQFCFLCFCNGFSLEDLYIVTELSLHNLGVAFFKTLISRSYLINFLIIGGFLWLPCTVCYSYSQLNLSSERLLSDPMWFLCRFRHIRYVVSGSYRNLIDSFCQHFYGKHRNKNTEPKQNKTCSMETFHR